MYINNKNKWFFGFIAMLVFLNLQGCSYIEAKKLPLNYAKTDINKYEGFPYYMKKPLLVVNDTNVSLIWVDDHTNFWAIKIGAVLAKNKSIIELGNNGAPTKIQADLEDDAIAIKFLDLASNALGEAMKAGLLGGSVPGSGATGKFQIFDFVYDASGNIDKLKPLITKELYPQMIDITPKVTVTDSNNGQADPQKGKKPDPNPPAK